ncbi:unnamed protein product [Protopolystoma xenopodis]|uniref:Uncharacterized protein n=1 Tax=Protopolystoma xenopodis TaxID=117903 RepID=A0A448XAF3_9PLAT|nr:unnamed protein product [Protopolystoma xenopodis]
MARFNRSCNLRRHLTNVHHIKSDDLVIFPVDATLSSTSAAHEEQVIGERLQAPSNKRTVPTRPRNCSIKKLSNGRGQCKTSIPKDLSSGDVIDKREKDLTQITVSSNSAVPMPPHKGLSTNTLKVKNGEKNHLTELASAKKSFRYEVSSIEFFVRFALLFEFTLCLFLTFAI